MRSTRNNRVPENGALIRVLTRSREETALLCGDSFCQLAVTAEWSAVLLIAFSDIITLYFLLLFNIIGKIWQMQHNI